MDKTLLIALWDKHLEYEFATRDTEATLATMVEDAYVNHVPVLSGGVGKEELREFYAHHFIPKMPPDTTITAVSRTVGDDRIVDEMVFQFTHMIAMDWMLPGVAPTGMRVEVPLVVIVHFRDGYAHERACIGIRRRCWCRSGCWIRASCRSPVSSRRARSSIRDCRRTS